MFLVALFCDHFTTPQLFSYLNHSILFNLNYVKFGSKLEICVLSAFKKLAFELLVLFTCTYLKHLNILQ